MKKFLNGFGYFCFICLILLLFYYILSYIPGLCIPFIFKENILAVFATLSVGFMIKNAIDKNRVLADKIYNHEFLNQMVILDAVDKLNFDDININKIISRIIKNLKKEIKDAKENKKTTFILDKELELYTNIKNGKITPEEAHKGWLHNFCKYYTEAYLVNQLNDEDKNEIDKTVKHINKIIDGGNNVNLHDGIYKYFE